MIRVASSPWPGITPGGPLVRAERPLLADITERINTYDRAASDSFVENWARSSGIWAMRSTLGFVGDKAYTLPAQNPFAKTVLPKLSSFSQDAVSYNRLLGIGASKLLKSSDVSWKEFLGSSEVRQAYRETVATNFGNLGRTQHLRAFSLTHYLKQTVVGNNVRAFYNALQGGRLCSFLSQGLGWSLLLGSVLLKTSTAYQSAKAAEDGTAFSRLRTLGKTALCFASEAFKSLMAWEAATLGAAIGSAIVCVGILPSVFAGFMMGGLFAAAMYKGLSWVLPQPTSLQDNAKRHHHRYTQTDQGVQP